ncbi:MAG: bifunctional demethylmenaquinone methyltransferase/2-methoxy-6-polyprenyl-1,4-benzoquinol methylase UbiE [Syntrophobacteraceae bacterium]
MSRSNTPEAEKMTHFGYLTVPEKEKVEWVRRHFNSVAHKYDSMNTLLSLGIHYQWKRMAISMMGLRNGDHVLDVCGGTGDLTRMAAERVSPSGRVVLYDINWEMMAAGRPKTSATPHSALVSSVQGDAEKIVFPDAVFDAAMVGFGIRNLTHFQNGFREMHRVLKPGGTFMCLEFSEPVTPWFRLLYDFYSFHVMPFIGRVLANCQPAYTYLPESIRLFPNPDELRGILEAIGFRDVMYRRLTDGIAVVHLGKKAG